MGAFSPPLRLTGRLLDLWAARHRCDDEIFEPPAGALIRLRPDEPPAKGELAHEVEETPKRRAGAPGAVR